MIPKTISPKQHGIADWGFVGALFAIPRLAKTNKGAQEIYDAFALDVIAINGVTDHGVGIVPAVSVKTHQKVDYANLALLGGLTFSKAIREDRRALPFHLSLLGLAVVNILLTDYDNENQKT